MTKEQHDRPESQSPVKNRREELGFTQRKLSLLSGVTIQTISNIETGRYEEVRLNPKQFKGICRALKWNDIEQVPDDWLPPKTDSKEVN